MKHTQATFQSCSIVNLLHGQPPNRVNDLSVAPETLVKGKRQKVLMQVDVIKLTGSFETKHPPRLIIIPLQFSC